MKEEYIRKKNAEISDYYLGLYRWYTIPHGSHHAVLIFRRHRKYPLPAVHDLALQHGIEISFRSRDQLVFSDPKWSGLEEGALLLKLEIPGEEIVFFDRKKWAKILSLSYIGTDEEEEAFSK